MNARGVLKFANEIMSHKYSNIYTLIVFNVENGLY